MSEGGINIYPGYTGILCLYHHITKHVIVQWTGLDGVDQQAKLDTEDNLLSFFKATVEVSKEDVIDNIAVDEMPTADIGGLHVEVAESNNSQSETVEYGVEPDHAFSEIAAAADINTLDTRVKDEPYDYAPTDTEVDANQTRMEEVYASPEIMEDITSTAVVEYSVSTDGAGLSTYINSVDTRVKDEPSDYKPIDIEIPVTPYSRDKMCTSPEMVEDTTLTSVVKDFVPKDGGSISTDVMGQVQETRKRDCKKRVTCDRCSFSFPYRSALVRHMRIHTGEKPYHCAQCNKTFTQTSHLNLHMMIHTGEKPYSCTQCNKTFNQARYLKLHMNIHTGEKPYNCTQCNKTFAQSSNLKQHMKTHTREKPYNCTQCNKTFGQAGTLKRHMRTHT